MPNSQECLSISLERYSYLFPSEWRLSAERYFGGELIIDFVITVVHCIGFNTYMVI